MRAAAGTRGSWFFSGHRAEDIIRRHEQSEASMGAGGGCWSLHVWYSVKRKGESAGNAKPSFFFKKRIRGETKTERNAHVRYKRPVWYIEGIEKNQPKTDYRFVSRSQKN